MADKNIFEQLTKFRMMLNGAQISPLLSQKEKNFATMFAWHMDNGKLFTISNDDFCINDCDFSFQNIPHPIMYITYGKVIYFLNQEKKDKPIYAYLAFQIHDIFEPIPVRIELRNNNGIVSREITKDDDISCDLEINEKNSAFFNDLAKDLYLLIYIMNEKKAAKTEEINTPTRKCKPYEKHFRSRFSIISIPNQEHANKNKEYNSTGRKVALHDRRGHYRRLPNKTIWVRPCKVGSIKNGIVIQQYQVSDKK